MGTEQQMFCTGCGSALVNGVCPVCGQQTAQPVHATAGAAVSPQAAYSAQQPMMNAQQPIAGVQGSPVNQLFDKFQSFGSQQPQQPMVHDDAAKFSPIFASADEKPLFALGNYIPNVAQHSDCCVLTDKRFYYRKMYKTIGTRTTSFTMIDLREISGVTQIKKWAPIYIMLAVLVLLIGIIGAVAAEEAWFFFTGFIWALIFVAFFFISKNRVFIVDHQGSRLQFRTKKFTEAECDELQRRIFAAKDIAHKL